MDGNSSTRTFALDDVFYNFRANLIKMDIEGAKFDALQGAYKIIEQDWPGLAICVYHHPTHLWQIPEVINSWHLGYSFYERTHAINGFDTVLYAISGKNGND
ncbi:MAG TPA: FkbM family methyltransferase [Desulfosporosinus sp.]|nr:FkbM family methyltransferase [Desulfosporosinus sp.]